MAVERPTGHQVAAHEFRTVQALRAYAALLIVVFHAYDAWSRIVTGAPGAAVVWQSGAAAVDIFFVISGFVMVISTRSLIGRGQGWRVFLVRRVQRIAPLYWLTTSLTLAIGLVQPSLMSHGEPGVWHIIASYLFLPARNAAGAVLPVMAVGWTLNFEMFFYALFALALALRLPVLRVLLIVLVPLALLGLLRQGDWPAISTYADGRTLEFCIGVAIAQFGGAAVRLGRYGGAALIGGGLLLLSMPFAGPWQCLLWGVPAGAVLLGGVAVERAWGSRLPRLLLRIGDASYAIYLIHPFVTPALARGLDWLALPPLATLLLEIAGAVGVSCAVGVFVHQRMEQPLMAWFRERRVRASALPVR